MSRSISTVGTRHLAVVGLALTLSAGVSPSYGKDPTLRCGLKKMAAAAKEVRSLLRCHDRAARDGAAADPTCVATAETALAKSFAKADASGTCATTGDAPTITGDLQAFVTDAASRLRPQATASRCAADKLAATGDLTSKLLKALIRDRRMPDSAQLQEALSDVDARLVRSFARAEQHGGCLTSNDAGTLAQLAYHDAALRVRSRLFAVCGDDFLSFTEQCDGGDDAACPGNCKADCTCPSCGNQIEEPGEQCDGAGCPRFSQFGLNGCFPPGNASECNCCALTDEVCYRADVQLDIPCCPGLSCVIGPRQPNNTGGCRPSCSQQSDCPTRSVCFCGGCTAPYPPCTQQSDCGNDSVCVNGGCWGPWPSCASSSCPPGFFCNPNPQVCVPASCGP